MNLVFVLYFMELVESCRSSSSVNLVESCSAKCGAVPLCHKLLKHTSSEVEQAKASAEIVKQNP